MTLAARRRMRAILRAAVLGTLTALVVTSCSDGHLDVRSVPAAGWSSYGGNSANSNFTYAQPLADLAPSWTRSAGGPVTSPVTMNGGGDVSISARTARGCNFTVLDYRAGRKNYCKRMADGFWGNAALVDQFSQPYIGEPGRFLALTGGGAIRWRHDLPGTPTSAKFAGPGRVLVTTTQGRVAILNSQNGDLAMPELKLWETTAEDPSAGLNECVTGGPGCAISAPPAVDWGQERIILNFFPQGAKTSQLKALRYGYRGEHRELSQEWTADLPKGVVGPPTVSTDGKTVYAFARDNKLYALDAATGETRWSHDVGDAGFATLSVSPDGVLIPAGKLGAPLTILKDEGDKVSEIARRDDLQTAGLSTLTTSGTAWTVVRTGADQHLELLEVDVESGETKRSLPMPDSKGFATGIAVSPNGQLAVATYAGTVYYFDAKG